MNYATAEGIRSFVAAFRRRDIAELQSAVTEDFIIVPVRVELEGITYHGRSGIEEWVTDVSDRWTAVRLEMEEVDEREPDLLLVFGRVIGQRREDGGAELDVPVAWVIRGRDGLIASIETFINRDAALAAADEGD